MIFWEAFSDPSVPTGTRKTLAAAKKPTARPDVLITVTLRSQRGRRGHAVLMLSHHMTLLSHPLRRGRSIAVYLTVAPHRDVSGTLTVVRTVLLPINPRYGITARRQALVVYGTTAHGRTDGDGRLWLTLHSVYLSSGQATGQLTIDIHGVPTTTVRINL